MAIPKHHIGFAGDMCQCGRRMSLQHCPHCGSSSNRARHNRWHEFMNGDVKKVDVELVCNLCGKAFVHEDRQWCQATPIGAADAARKLQMLAQAEASPNLTPSEKTAASTAKELIKALKLAGQPTDEAEIKALEKVERIAQGDLTPEQKYNEWLVQKADITGMYNEEVIKARAEGREHENTLEEYIDKVCSQFNIERPEKPL